MAEITVLCFVAHQLTVVAIINVHVMPNYHFHYVCAESAGLQNGAVPEHLKKFKNLTWYLPERNWSYNRTTKRNYNGAVFPVLITLEVKGMKTELEW